MERFHVYVAILTLAFFQVVFSAPSFRFNFGTVSGVDSQALETGALYYSYFGIPFAKPPVGPLRFKQPEPFTGAGPDVVITASDFRNACVQKNPSVGDRMGEDCLHLNVFTPPARQTPTARPKKVMVWIHGGGFSLGEAWGFIPGRMVTDYDVIVVSVQYRLGLLGFLSSGDDVLPGNLGLWDQVLAIKWVKENIAVFGGDADDIIVFGESAGAASVSLLALSPQTKGLFSKAIMMSGTALASWATKDPKPLFIKAAKDLNCLPLVYTQDHEHSYHQRILKCLITKNASDLNYSPDFDIDEFFSDGLAALIEFAPVVDGKLIQMDPAVLLRNVTFLRANGILDRSYVVGFTNQEGLILASIIKFYTPDEKLERLVDPSIVADNVRTLTRTALNAPPTQDMLNLVDFIYTFPRRKNNTIPLGGIIDLASDKNFVVPSVSFARALADKTSVYLYLFDHHPKLKSSDFPIKGSIHGMDLAYLFDRPRDLSTFFSFYADVFTPESDGVSEAIQSTMTNFAKSEGQLPVYKPNISQPGSMVWPRYELSKQHYLAISATPEVRTNVYAQRVSLWTEFLPRMLSKSSFFGDVGRAAFG